MPINTKGTDKSKISGTSSSKGNKDTTGGRSPKKNDGVLRPTSDQVSLNFIKPISTMVD